MRGVIDLPFSQWIFLVTQKASRIKFRSWPDLVNKVWAAVVSEWADWKMTMEEKHLQMSADSRASSTYKNMPPIYSLKHIPHTGSLSLQGLLNVNPLYNPTCKPFIRISCKEKFLSKTVHHFFFRSREHELESDIPWLDHPGKKKGVTRKLEERQQVNNQLSNKNQVVE